MACSAARTTIRPPDGVAPGLGGSDPLLNARLQQLRFGQGQPQIGDVSEFIGPDDIHDIQASRFTLAICFDQPQNPPHASSPSRRIADGKHHFIVHTPKLDSPSKTVPTCTEIETDPAKVPTDTGKRQRRSRTMSAKAFVSSLRTWSRRIGDQLTRCRLRGGD